MHPLSNPQEDPPPTKEDWLVALSVTLFLLLGMVLVARYLGL